MRVFIDVIDNSHYGEADAIEKDFDSLTQAVEWCKKKSSPECIYRVDMQMTIMLNI